MRFQFNAHNLIVYGREGEEFLVSDPVFEHAVRIKAEDLQNARFAKGTLAPKGFMYYPVRVNPSVDLREAIRKSIKRTVHMMLHAPLPFIGVKGIHYLAKKIERLNVREDLRYVRLFLGHIVRMQEEIGTGGGGFRFMYAAFLQEAGLLLGSALLGEASQMMTEAGDMWRRFALACAKACKSKTADFDVREIAELLRKCATQEKLVYSLLNSMKLMTQASIPLHLQQRVFSPLVLVDMQKGPSRKRLHKQADATGRGRAGISVVAKVIKHGGGAQSPPQCRGFLLTDPGAEGNHVHG